MHSSEQQDSVRQWLSDNLERIPLGSVSDAPVDVAKVLQTIHARLYAQDLAVDAVLSENGIKSSGFSSRFKYHTSLPPGGYIRHLRLETARLAIPENPEVSLRTISSEIGYSNYSTFARQFKEEYGAAPSAFR